jgi:hypothetical protein
VCSTAIKSSFAWGWHTAFSEGDRALHSRLRSCNEGQKLSSSKQHFMSGKVTCPQAVSRESHRTRNKNKQKQRENVVVEEGEEGGSASGGGASGSDVDASRKDDTPNVPLHYL